MVEANRALEFGRTAARLGNRGYVRLKLGDFGEALRDYEEAASLPEPPSAYRLLGRGLVHAMLNDPASALLDIEQGLLMAEAVAFPSPQLRDLIQGARFARDLLRGLEVN